MSILQTRHPSMTDCLVFYRIKCKIKGSGLQNTHSDHVN